MIQKSCFIAIFVILLTNINCNSGGYTQSSYSLDGKAVFSVKTEKRSYRLQEPIDMTFTLRNISEKSLLGCFLLDFGSSVYITIVDEKGKVLQPNIMHDPPHYFSASDYMYLWPGYYIGKKVHINFEEYTINESGIYSIKISYENWHVDRTTESLGKEEFSSELKNRYIYYRNGDLWQAGTIELEKFEIEITE